MSACRRCTTRRPRSRRRSVVCCLAQARSRRCRFRGLAEPRDALSLQPRDALSLQPRMYSGCARLQPVVPTLSHAYLMVAGSSPRPGRTAGARGGARRSVRRHRVRRLGGTHDLPQLSISQCLHISLSLRVSSALSLRLHPSVSISPSFHLSIHPFTYPPIHPSTPRRSHRRPTAAAPRCSPAGGCCRPCSSSPPRGIAIRSSSRRPPSCATPTPTKASPT